jgi:hypothetical protein
MLKYCKDENYLQILKVDGVDTIGIFEKEFLYLFQYIIKIQRSFSKIDIFYFFSINSKQLTRIAFYEKA